MKLARAVLPWDANESAVDELLDKAELDFLQLDFVWPDRWRCDSQSDENLLGKWATGLIAQLKIVHKALFLRPELCLLTNAGGGNTIGAMEALAVFLTEHGSSEMPVAAVRGENLLSSIEWLPKTIPLKDRHLLAAHAEMGGAPLANALTEGARIVLTGVYNSTAPFLAAAISRGICSWHDVDALGNIAAASQFENVLVSVEGNGDIELATAAESQLTRVRALAINEHADVTCDYSDMKLSLSGRNTLRISDVRSKSTTSIWKLRETYDAGYRATALIETPVQRVAEIQEFRPNDVSADKLSIQVLAAEGTVANHLIRMQREASTVRECQQFVELLQSWLRQKFLGEFAEPLPSLVHLTETMEICIPVDRLTISVDTRPASEWL